MPVTNQGNRRILDTVDEQDDHLAVAQVRAMMRAAALDLAGPRRLQVEGADYRVTFPVQEVRSSRDKLITGHLERK